MEDAKQTVNKLGEWAGILAETFPKIQQIYEILQGTIVNNPNAIPYASNFALFAASIAIFCKSYWLSLEIDEHIGKLGELVNEFSVLYDGEMKLWLDRVNQRLGPSHGMMLEGEVKELKSRLQSFTKSVEEILERVYRESLNNIQCQTKSHYLGFFGLGTTVVAGGAAFMFPPAGAVMVIGYAGSGLLGLVTAGFSLSNSNRLQDTNVKVDKLVREINECRKEIKTVITRLDIDGSSN